MSAAVRLSVILLIMTAGVSAQATTPQARPPARADNVVAGKALYTKMTCYYCHGTAGQGGAAGVRIAQVQRSPEAFIRYIRRPTGAMPAYSERILTDEQLTDLYAFVRSLPAAKPAKDIPLLGQLTPGR